MNIKTLSFLQKKWLALVFVWIVVFIFLSPVLTAGFTNWDDNVHLTSDHAVRALTWENIREMFSRSINTTYIPLMSLSFAVEYHFFKYNPFIYHLNNLLLHLVVVTLVFVLALHLRLSLLSAFFAALLFGIHPMHVESVAWITERKDGLYGTFYLLSLWMYGKFLDTSKTKWLVFSCAACFLSILSKPMALSLPLVLFVMDFYKNRAWDKKVFLTKIPYFMIVVPIALITYLENLRGPGQGGWDSPLNWIWAFNFYISNFIFPVNLNPLYRMPEPISLLNIHYAAAVVLTFGLLWSLYRFRHERLWVGAVGFFFLSVFFLLRVNNNTGNQGPNIVADRFMYLPSVGFCLFLGDFIRRGLERWQGKQGLVVSGVILTAGIFMWLGVKSYQMSLVWKDSLSLWNAVIEKNPNIALAYNNRGEVYSARGQYDLAIADYQKVLSIDRFRPNTYNNIADAFSARGRDDLALLELEKSIKLSNSYQALYNRGNIYHKLGQYDLALKDYEAAVRINPDFPQTYNNRGLIYLSQKQYDLALNDFNRAVKIDPLFFEGFNNRAYLYIQKGEYALAVKDASRALELNKNNSSAYFNRANANRLLGNNQEAMEDYSQAIGLDGSNGVFFLHRSLIYLAQQEYNEALADAQKAQSLGVQGLSEYLEEIKKSLKR